MVVLRAIGRFFARIGRWIRDTAWVQPLLIVGAIFGLIFSIPYIVNGIKSLGNNGSEWQKFYNDRKISLENAENGESDVDKLFASIETNTVDTKKYGEKFFLSFVKKDCSVCEDQYEGWKQLKANWGKNEFADVKGETFKLYTVFIDTTKEINGTDEVLFKYVWNNHSYLFENFTMNYEESEYAQYKEYTEGCTQFTNLNEADDDGNFKVESPTTFYFDFTKPVSESSSWGGNSIDGLCEIMFSIPGETDMDKARTFHDCWTHAGVFQDHNYYND